MPLRTQHAAAACVKFSASANENHPLIKHLPNTSFVWKFFGFRGQQIICKEHMRLVSAPQTYTTELFIYEINEKTPQHAVR